MRHEVPALLMPSKSVCLSSFSTLRAKMEVSYMLLKYSENFLVAEPYPCGVSPGVVFGVSLAAARSRLILGRYAVVVMAQLVEQRSQELMSARRLFRELAEHFVALLLAWHAEPLENLVLPL